MISVPECGAFVHVPYNDTASDTVQSVAPPAAAVALADDTGEQWDKLDNAIEDKTPETKPKKRKDK